MLVTIVGLAMCCNHVMDENVTHEARCVRMGFVIRLQSHRLQLTQVRH